MRCTELGLRTVQTRRTVERSRLLRIQVRSPIITKISKAEHQRRTSEALLLSSQTTGKFSKT